MIETKRLILRNYKASDIDDYWEYVSQEKVGPMCGWPTYVNKTEANNRLVGIECAKPYQFAIELKQEHKVIGSVELMDYKQERYSTIKVKNGAKEIGYLLNESYWGQGIMPEAVRAVVDYAFCTLNIPEIVICHAEANTQSGRVQEKLGFKICGRIDNYRTWIDGNPTALIQRKMTREEYCSRQQND